MIQKKLLIGVLAFLLLISTVPTVTAKSDSFSWYCVRNKDHKQPIADANMQFIEDYDGYYIDHSHSDEAVEKKIYLTFDAGYENGNVGKILDVLKEEQVCGAFFVLSNLIQRNPELISRMEREGHLICNHTSRHRDMSKIESKDEFAEELYALEKAYKQVTGKDMAKFYRPPEGKFNQRSMQFARDLGYKTIFWSLAYADWDNRNQPSPEAAKKKLLDNVHNGAIVLLHPTSSVNAQILGDVIRELKSLGYCFGSLYELMGEAPSV